VKTKTFLALFVGAVATLAIAQAPRTYPPEEAAKHVGETATVKGMVDGFHQSGKGNIFLNMGGKYPNQSFTAFIPSGSAGQFSNPQQYDGRTVSVTGKIELYKGKPEIIVRSPSQITQQ
jgi:DNA/RNA endonuclease YhcR with UshA esterase domain